MKLQFTPAEQTWLHDKLTNLLLIASNQNDREFVRQSARLRYKFAPNARVVYLNANEKRFLKSLVDYRTSTAERLTLANDEGAILDALTEKLT